MQVLNEKVSLEDLFGTHERFYWGNSILVQRPESTDGIHFFDEVLLINLWDSLLHLPDDFYVHPSLSTPSLKKEEYPEDKDKIVLGWEMTLLKKKKE